MDALFDQQAGATAFPFSESACQLLIGPTPEGDDHEFSGRVMRAEDRERPSSGTLFRCATHDTAFLVVGIPDKFQLRCSDAALTKGPGVVDVRTVQLGKRYIDPLTKVELLCIKPAQDGNEGDILNVNGRPAMETVPNVLPSAD